MVLWSFEFSLGIYLYPYIFNWYQLIIYWLNRHEFGLTPGVDDGQGGLACSQVLLFICFFLMVSFLFKPRFLVFHSICPKNLLLLYFWVIYLMLTVDLIIYGASLVAQMVKNLPTMQENQVWLMARKNSWRMEWLPTAVSLPGKSHGQRSLAGCRIWGHKESNVNNHFTFLFFFFHFTIYILKVKGKLLSHVQIP